MVEKSMGVDVEQAAPIARGQHDFHILRLSWPSSGPELCVVWLRKTPASG